MKLLRGHLELTGYFDRVQIASTGGYRLFSATQESTVIGVIGFRIQHDLCWGHNLYVDDLVVDKLFRRRGIGTALMSHAQKLAAESRCEFVRLASGVDKLEAHRFYEALGYKKTSYAFALKL